MHFIVKYVVIILNRIELILLCLFKVILIKRYSSVITFTMRYLYTVYLILKCVNAEYSILLYNRYKTFHKKQNYLIT